MDRAHVDAQLALRQAGYGRSPRQKLETDTVEVTSGLRHGVTLGSPVALRVANRDHGNWSAAMSIWPTDDTQGNWRDRPITLPRPGHADLGGAARSNFSDMRNVLERASARETAARVAVGSIAQQLLGNLGVVVSAHVRAIGTAQSDAEVPGRNSWDALEGSNLRCLDIAAEAKMIEQIDSAKADRDTLGGIVEVVAYGLPPGLGGYTTPEDRLDSRLACAAMGVQAMKAVEVGEGISVAAQRGSVSHDEMHPALDGSTHGMGVKRETNHAGGIEGGMTNGAPIVIRAFMKPLPTLMRPLASVDLHTGESKAAHAERSDVCAVPAAAIVLETVVAFELAKLVRELFGMAAFSDVHRAWNAYCERVKFPQIVTR